MSPRFLAVLLAPTMLGACATIAEGTTKNVSVVTTPPGASCALARAGAPLGTINPTPGSVTLSKSKNDINVSCTKPGYKPANITVSPKFVGTTFANLLVGGVVGVVADAASGANFDPPAQIEVALEVDAPAVTEAATTAFGITPENTTTRRRTNPRRSSGN
jgi:hypothetical protein